MMSQRPAAAETAGKPAASGAACLLSFVAPFACQRLLPPASPNNNNIAHRAATISTSSQLPLSRACQYFDRATTDLTFDHCHCHLTALSLNRQPTASPLLPYSKSSASLSDRLRLAYQNINPPL